MMYVLIFILQLVYVFLRTSYINAISEGKVIQAVIVSSILSALWLIGTSIGVNAIIMESDYVMGAIYVLGSMVGTFTALTIEKRNKTKKEK